MAKLLDGSRIYGNAVIDSTLTAANLAANSNIASTTTTTGALIVAGGAGITGNVNIGGIRHFIAGNVGIGTTTPSSDTAIALTLNSTGTTNTGGGVQFTAQNNGGGAIQATTGGGLQFWTFTGPVGTETFTEPMFISNTGNVVILSATTSSNVATGALVITGNGGAGIGGNLNVGGTIFNSGVPIPTPGTVITTSMGWNLP